MQVQWSITTKIYYSFDQHYLQNFVIPWLQIYHNIFFQSAYSLFCFFFQSSFLLFIDFIPIVSDPHSLAFDKVISFRLPNWFIFAALLLHLFVILFSYILVFFFLAFISFCVTYLSSRWLSFSDKEIQGYVF